MRYRTLGGLRVGAVGLGAMPLSIEGRPDEERALDTAEPARLTAAADHRSPPVAGP